MTLALEKYKADIKKLIEFGGDLHNAIQNECYPDAFKLEAEKALGKEAADKFLKSLPTFKNKYQSWYSEAQVLIKQLLPNRYVDFIALYEKPKSRKVLDHGNYVIADYLQGLQRSDGGCDPSSAIPQFQQQLNILKSVQNRFESSLFDIKQLVQGDLFDSELEAARELLRNKFERAAGAVAGVVLEKHLQQVCESHNVNLSKRDGTIAILNDALKAAGAIETPQWRFIQHLGDLRNLCDHSKEATPTKEQVTDLIEGVSKISKTLF